MVLDLRVGDVVRLKRKHPCGGFEWNVVRVGADIGLNCISCGRRVLMDRSLLRRRAVGLVERGLPIDPSIEAALEGDSTFG